MDIEIPANAQPAFQRAYPVAQAHLELFKKELLQLCKFGVLAKTRPTGWAAPTFIIPKKDNRIRWVSDFRRLNRVIKRKPYALPIIHDILRRRAGYKFFTKIDISMQYYTFGLTKRAQDLCVITTPFGYYKYLRVPMGILTSPDFAQEQMESILGHLKDVEIYIDNIGIFSNSWEDHLKSINEVLRILQEHNFVVNPLKCKWAVQETDWLGYWLTPQGLRPWKKRVQSILDIERPQTITKLRSFIGAITFYRDMFPRRSHILAPLTALIGSNKAKKTLVEWTKERINAFEQARAMLVKATLMRYPDHNKPFHIYTDASNVQLGAAIFQEGHPVAFYTRKLNSAQRNYSTIDKELLSIVETLRKYRTTLFGAPHIHIYTDHRNLTGAQFTLQQVLRWRLFLEEYGPTFHYIKGKKNLMANALSRLPLKERQDPITLSDSRPYAKFLFDVMQARNKPEDARDEFDSGHCFSVLVDNDELKECLLNLPAVNAQHPFPLRYNVICNDQANNAALQQQLVLDPTHYKQTMVAPLMELITYKAVPNGPWRICLPEACLLLAAQWYHQMLNHPGSTRLRQTMELVFQSPKLRATCEQLTAQCDTCQRAKVPGRGHGHLAPREALLIPWRDVAVDLIGPWMLTWQGYTITFNALSVIDQCTNMLELQQIQNKTAAHVGMHFQNCWLSRYPRPTQVVYDQGTKFVGKGFQDVLERLHIHGSPITRKNPQGNSLVERVHQSVGNALRALKHTTVPDGVVTADDIIDIGIADGGLLGTRGDS